jgi:hypothetical protein
LMAALFLALRGSPHAAVVLLLPPALALFAALWVGRKSPAASVPAVMPLLENIQLPMVLLDRQARILAVNNAFTRELGFQAMGQGGIGLRDLLSQRHGTGGLKPLWGDALGKGRWEGQAWLRRRDGSAFAPCLPPAVPKGPPSSARCATSARCASTTSSCGTWPFTTR